MGRFRRKRSEGDPPIMFEDHDATPVEPSGRSFGFKSASPAVRAGVAAEDAADERERPAPVSAGRPVDGWVLVPFGWAAADRGAFDRGALSRRVGEADEEHVMEVAGAWSVDPGVLDERDDVPDTGPPGRR